MIFIFRLVVCLNSINVQGKINTLLLCPHYIPGSSYSGVSHPLVHCFDKSDARIPAPTAECQCGSRVLKQMYVLSSCRGGGSEGPEPGARGVAVVTSPWPAGRLSLSCSPFNDRPMCRICHEGSSQEDLLSPCECTGTLGTIHRSCLEHWLSSSNTSYCELCHFRFAVERKPRPLVEVSNWGTSWNLSSNEQMMSAFMSSSQTLCHFIEA